MELQYTTFETGGGWVGVLVSAQGLVAVSLPQASAEAARRVLSSRVNEAARSNGALAGLAGRLKSYFSGQPEEFPDELDLSAATPFQREVWQAARRIPYGRTLSYAELARRTGRPGAARAVGQALSKNPLPIIIPCHRVVASNGGMGGFSGGMEMKKYLLRLESAEKIS